MKQFIAIVCFICLPHMSFGASSLDSLLMELDRSIADREYYFEKKNDTLLALRTRLLAASSLREKYEISKQLLYQYSYYDNYATLYYANNCLEIAGKMGDKDRIVEAKLLQANYFLFSGLSNESFEILKSIDPIRLSLDNKRKYYMTYMYVCTGYTRQQNASQYKDEYVEMAIHSADSYLRLEMENTTKYLSVLAFKYSLEKNYLQAINTIKVLLKRDDITPYLRAEHLYYLGLIYRDLGNHDAAALKAFVKSATASNELAITKLPASLYVGMLLVNTNNPHMGRADKYVDVALEDAVIYGDKYRSDFIKTTYYSIQGMNLEKAEIQKHTYKVVILTGLSFLLALTLLLAILLRNYAIMNKNKKKLHESNAKLRDLNHIREAYIKFFLNRNSEHIEEVGRNKRYLLRILGAGASSDKLKQEIATIFDTDDDYNRLMADFDKSIMELYPNFVDEVNKLLKPGLAYSVDNNSGYRLNTELRILALARLGVTDNKQIASFLRITVQSVYNYSSKARSKAVNEDTFDGDLENLCM